MLAANNKFQVVQSLSQLRMKPQRLTFVTSVRSRCSSDFSALKTITGILMPFHILFLFKLKIYFTLTVLN